MEKYKDMVPVERQAKAVHFLSLFQAAQNAEYSAAVHQAIDQEKAGQLSEAQATIRKALAIDDTKMAAYILNGILDFEAGDCISAEANLRKGLDRAPVSRQEGIDGALGVVLATAAAKANASGNYAVAAKAYEEAWSRQPQYPMFGIAAASSFALAGNRRQAAKIANQLVVSSDPAIQSQAKALLQHL